MFCLSLHKKWYELPATSFCATALIMLTFLDNREYIYPNENALTIFMLVYSSATYFLFSIPILFILKKQNSKIINIILIGILITNNVLYMKVASSFIEDFYQSYINIIPLLISGINVLFLIWLKKEKTHNKPLTSVLFGLIISFLALTTPMFDRNCYILIFLATEVPLTTWLFIKTRFRIYHIASIILFFITIIYGILTFYSESSTSFMNFTLLYVGLASLATAILMQYHQKIYKNQVFPEKFSTIYGLLYAISIGIIYLAIQQELEYCLPYMTSISIQFLLATLTFTCVRIAFRNSTLFKSVPMTYAIMGIYTMTYLIDIWNNSFLGQTWPIVLQWITAFLTFANLFDIARKFYISNGRKQNFTCYLNIIAVILWITTSRSTLLSVNISDFSLALSLSLCIIGTIQMGIGMRIHNKSTRIMSLFTFGTVLLKLIIYDLWNMSSLNKVITFIFIGLLLLTLSFLYQKLRNILFKDEKETTEQEMEL
jgi:hypothetical protein